MIAASLLFGAIWAVGALLPIGIDPVNGPPEGIYLLSDLWFSVMLASFAIVAWLVVRLVPHDRLVAAPAWLLVAAGIAGAVGNLLEDVFAVPNAENVYFFGFMGVLASLLLLALALAARRRFGIGALIAGTLAGVVVMAGHGPPLVPVLWFATAGAAALQRERAS